MSQQYQNSIGQTINVGDEIIYIGWQHSRYQGEFLGLTTSNQVRIALKGGKKMYKRKWGKSKLYTKWDRVIWEIPPGALMVDKSDGRLITYQDWAKLSYTERYGANYREEYYDRHPGILDDTYEEITVPNIWVGPKGLERTFKVV